MVPISYPSALATITNNTVGWASGRSGTVEGRGSGSETTTEEVSTIDGVKQRHCDDINMILLECCCNKSIQSYSVPRITS